MTRAQSIQGRARDLLEAIADGRRIERDVVFQFASDWLDLVGAILALEVLDQLGDAPADNPWLGSAFLRLLEHVNNGGR